MKNYLNKSIIALLLLLIVSLSVNAQIIDAEYFWDTDPGEGSGISIGAADGALDEAIEVLLNDPTNVPAEGIHSFNIRIKDNNNNWGPVFSSVISVENIYVIPDKKILQAEYFWDTDPGIGMGTTILALDGNLDETTETLFNGGISTPGIGRHTFNVRIKDIENNWGPIFSSVISIEEGYIIPDKKIIQAEYFWGSDPSEGSGTPILAMDGNLDEAIEALLLNDNTTLVGGLRNFSVRLKDNNNNWGPVFISTIYFEGCEAPLINLGADQVLCDGSSLTLDATAGFDSYEWSDGSTNQTLDVIAPGTYSVTATHSSGCDRADTIMILSQQDVDLGNDTIICFGNNVVLDAGVFVDYSWSTLQTSQSINVSPASINNYSVTVTDIYGCISRDTIEVDINPLPIADAGMDQSVCQSGTVTLTATGGINYEWSANETTASINVNPVVTTQYIVTVTDNNGCSTSDTVVVNITPAPIATVTGGGAICGSGSVDVSIALTGTAPWDITYTDGTTPISVTTSDNPYVVTTSTEGTYEVTSISDVNCTGTASGTAVVTVNPLPTAIVSGGGVICSNDEVLITVDLTGTAPWDITYTDGTTPISVTTSDNPYEITTSTEGTYEVTSITDGYCTGTTTGTAVVIVNPIPTVLVSGEGVICESGSVDVIIELTGTSPWDITYNDGTTDFSGTIDDSPHVISVSTDGVYQVTSVSDANCTGTASGIAEVTVNSLPTAAVTGGGVICADEETTVLVALTGVAPWDIIYTDGATPQIVNTSDNPYIITTSTAGTYEITSINDANCTGTASGNAEVTVNPIPTVEFNTIFEDACVDGGLVELTGATPAGGIYSGTSVNGANFDPFIGAGVYTITYTYDNGTCSNSATQNIAVVECNHAPEFTSTPITVANVDELYTYSITATDVDGDNIAFDATTIPSWLTFTQTTGGIINLVSGTDDWGGFTGDNGPAISAELDNPTGVSVDNSGNIYFADQDNDRVRMINTSGIITTVAGNGSWDYNGENVSATSVGLYNPTDVAVDNAGNLYIAEKNKYRIRKVDINGNITTIAGTGYSGYTGDGGAATNAKLRYPTGVAVDNSGNVYIADNYNHCIRMVNPSGIISTIAGTGSSGSAGDNGPAVNAELDSPNDVTVDNSGNIYIADTDNNKIRMINSSGIITTFAGTGGVFGGYSGDGGLAINAELNGPMSIAIDNLGNIYIADEENHRIRKVDASGIITTFAGNSYGYSGDGGLATLAELDNPKGVAVDNTGNIYIADSENHRIRKVDAEVIQISGTPTISDIGTHDVVITVNDGFVTAEQVFTIIVSGTNNVSAAVSGGGTACEGESVDVFINLSGVAPWTVIYSDGSNSNTITTSDNPYVIAATSSGSYTITSVSDAYQTGVANGSAIVTVNSLPEIPVVTQVGEVLSSSATTGNQWYLSGDIISGATAQSYTPNETGNYSVEVANEFGCSQISDNYYFNFVGIGDVDNTYVISIYPNPNNGLFNITIDGIVNDDIQISLLDARGRLLLDKTIENAKTLNEVIDLREYPKGIFILKLLTNDKVISKKVIYQ